MRVTPLWTIRARLTALIAVLVLVVGGTLLLANYWWLTGSLPGAQVQEVDGRFAVDIDGSTPIELPSGGVIGPSVEPVASPAESDDTALIADAVAATSLGLAQNVTEQVGRQSLVLLLALTVAAVAVGWVTARRALRPVHDMTAAARRVGATSLSERLPIDGPRDEISDLGETFNDLLDRVEEAAGRERRLVADLAHELRTPLANQRIVLEMGLEDADGGTGVGNPQGLVDSSRTALQQNLRAQRLIEQLLLLARVEQAERESLHEETVDLGASVAAIVAEPALRALGPPGVGIELDPPPATPTSVRCEPVLLDRLIGNIVENAVRHNVVGGRVWITISAPIHGAGPEVVIENTGPVVPAEVLPSLFEPLRRGPAATSRERVGTHHDGAGLGLTLVAAIALRLGVHLHANPRPQGGLTVRLSWPPQAPSIPGGSREDPGVLSDRRRPPTEGPPHVSGVKE